MDKLTLSHSAIICFLNNQIQFKKRYVARVYDDAKTPAMVVGSAIHKMIEKKLSGEPTSDAIKAGLDEIDKVSDYEIDYAKTGSREEMLEQYNKLSITVINELPNYSNVLAIEDKIECDLTILGKRIPMKGYIDLILDHGDWLEVVDFKSVKSYSDEGTENYKYLIQAWIYAQLVEFKYNKPVNRFVFSEIKKSTNRNKERQIQNYVLDRQGIIEANDVIGRTIKNVSDYIDNPNAIYFPNPSDMLNGNRSMEVVAQMDGISVRTIHRTERKEKFSAINVDTDLMDESAADTDRIKNKLVEFGIGGEIIDKIESNQVVTYILKPSRGVKMSKIAGLEDDIAIALGSEAIRIIAPIYGTTTVGIEVPKKQEFPVFTGSLTGTQVAIGVDTMGNTVMDDVAKMPHMLIGGQTGSGKSVFAKNIIRSLVADKSNDITIIDQKMVEMIEFANDCNVITEQEDAMNAVLLLVSEMQKRYKKFMTKRAVDIDSYNAQGGRLNRKILMIDEYADLVMSLDKGTRQDLETQLSRILQKGRAAGIHVIIATQRPSADIVAPIIKANCPVKVCMRVATARNSEIILDSSGGERLLGKGDMLYLGTDMINPVRLQGFAPIA